MLAFAEQGLNSLPYYQNKDFARIVSLVPTSAHTGEGVPVSFIEFAHEEIKWLTPPFIIGYADVDCQTYAREDD